MPSAPPPRPPIDRLNREHVPGSAREARVGAQVPGEGAPTGRYRKLDATPADLSKTIDLLKGLGSIQATERECAAVLGVAHSTLRDFWSRCPEARDTFDDARLVGRVSLRRAQSETALAGNATMQIWLGKQWLNQRDFAPEKPADASGSVPINIDSLTLVQLKQIAARIRLALAGQDGVGDQQQVTDQSAGAEPA